MVEIKNLNLERIINILKEHKEELRGKYGVKEMGVFGSYVRGEYKKKNAEGELGLKVGENDYC
ncbi:unnamed protein product [marine sediment metagenome]|uniref:Polymerase nucleotidyl transferase domain-containing protein n=1 Tax=marine sediment metagenome TaxID=412755 RepID=X1GD94_9ZZZZ